MEKPQKSKAPSAQEIAITTKKAVLRGLLSVPKDTKGIVLFAHGSGSGRLSPRNQYVASVLADGGIATLLMDLLTLEEEAIDEVTRHLRFDIPLLATRLGEVAEWVKSHKDTKNLNIGYFGASTGAAAALISAYEKKKLIKAVVSRGGRPDLAAKVLPQVLAPTLLIVGGDDYGVIELNQSAYDLLQCEKKFEIIPHATHLFEEPGTLEQAAHQALNWFKKHLE
jgi:putative phosphoribosyl transferase